MEEVREYRRKKGLEGDISLLQDRKEQSRLQDWVEFQYWEYKKVDRLEEDRERYADEVLPRQNVLLKWIDEQLLIIASECQTSVIGTHVSNDCESPSVSTSLGKRKRSANQTGHVKDSRRRVEFVEPCDTESLPVKNADIRESRRADLSKSQAPRKPNTRQRRHRNAHQEACADGDTIHTLDISNSVHRKSSSRRTNSSRRDRTRVDPVQTQGERRSVRAGSNSSGLRQEPAATSTEEEIAFQKSKVEPTTSVASSKRRSSTASAPQSTILRPVHSSRVSKTLGPARIQASPEDALGDDARR